MIDRLRAAGRVVARSPAWQIVIGGAALAVAFPARMPGAIGLAALAGAGGVGRHRGVITVNWNSPYTEFEFVLDDTTTKADYIPDDWPEAEGELPPSLEYLLGKFIQAIQGATGILKNDYQNVMLWYETMRQALITYIQAAYMAGQNSDYIGETENGHI